jgi:hypothetical protein
MIAALPLDALWRAESGSQVAETRKDQELEATN